VWWLAHLATRDPHGVEPPVPVANWVAVVDLVRLRYGQPASGVGLRQVEVPGCSLLVVGCCTSSDSELSVIAQRVARADLSSLSALDGSAAVIAARRDDVVLVGDLAGQHIIFYTRSPSGDTVAGSHASRVAAFSDSPIDQAWLAARLALPEASDVWWTGSPWTGVRALRSGWALRVSRSGRVTTTPIATLPAPVVDLGHAGECLRSALVRAVRTRAEATSRLTVDLSGGLDSSTVAVLAASMARDLVHAVTLDVPGVDDAMAACAIAAEVSGLAQETLQVPDSVLPYSGLDSVPLLDEPAEDSSTIGRTTWWLQHLAGRGSDVHLSGDGGDAVLLARPSYLADLAAQSKFRALWRHARGWSRLRNQAPHALIRAAVSTARSSYATALRQLADELARGESRQSGWAGLVTWFRVSPIVEWMPPEQRALVAERICHHADEHAWPVVPVESGIGDAAAWLSLNTFSRAQRAYSDLAASYGVNHHAPYLDNAVVRACWSVPAWARTTPEQPKPLLRRAVGDLVPQRLVQRRTKGDYSALVYKGLRRNRKDVDDLLTRSRLGELGLIDETKVRAELAHGAAGIPVRLSALDAVVSAELWLRLHDTANQDAAERKEPGRACANPTRCDHDDYG
jgi:asparagine synthase (glutamine-hydrolysing)